MADMSQPPILPPGPWAPPQQQAVPLAPPGTLDFPVLFEPAAADAAVKVASRARTWRLVSLGISVAISAALWWFFREQLGDFTWLWVAVVLVLPVSTLAWTVLREIVIRRDVRRAGVGLALGIGRRGLFLGGMLVPWTQVGSVALRSGRLGASDRVVVTPQDGPVLHLPLNYLSAGPAQLDSAVFALSGGRVRVDFSALDL